MSTTVCPESIQPESVLVTLTMAVSFWAALGLRIDNSIEYLPGLEPLGTLFK